jgi:hypothetical protein
MNKQGLTLRGYSRRAGIRLSYTQKLIATGIIVPLSDGSIDPQQADRGRAELTIVGEGARRQQRRIRPAVPPTLAPGLTRCEACGGLYDVAWNTNAPFCGGDSRFCTDDCREMSAAGLTVREIRRRKRDEFLQFDTFSEAELAALGDRFCDWVHEDGSPVN